MKNEVEQALGPLVSLPLWALGRSVDLAWFEFGSRRSVKGSKGIEKEVGDYALHVQCAWRITHSEKVIIGCGDIFSVPQESTEPIPGDFDWQKGNRFDRIAADLLQNESLTLVVLSVNASDAGSFSIGLQDGYNLEVFPDHSESGEHWRFFKPYTAEPHFVFSGRGFQQE
jgi:hypothetical protein